MPSSKIIIKYFIFLLGLFFMGLGISLITKSNLGTPPISSFPFVLSLIFPVTFGQLTFLLSLVFLLVQIIILRRDFPKEQLLQVLVGSFFGFFVDLGMAIFAFVNPNLYAEKIIALLLGCIILALGINLQVAPNVIVNPGEGVVKTIADRTGKEFGIIKMILDSSLVFIAAAISLFAFGTIKGIREGTIISAILIGYITKIFGAIFKHINSHFKNRIFEH
jgi:uncharacterized membrane protein YczE